MKRKRSSVEQIVEVLKQAGVPVANLASIAAAQETLRTQKFGGVDQLHATDLLVLLTPEPDS